MALGHRLLSVTADAAGAVAAALTGSGGDAVRPVDDVKPRIIVEGVELDLSSDRARLVDDGRDWLAEIAVLALEFHSSPIIRSTARTRPDDEAIASAFGQRRSRSVTFGGHDIEGGASGSLQAVVDALQAGLASKAFHSRSGPAVLTPFPEGDERPPKACARRI